MDEIVLDAWGMNPRIKGTRTTVYLIVHYLEGGWEPAQIAEVSQLSVGQVNAAIEYIETHRDEVMAVHGQIEERMARGNPPEIVAKLEASHLKALAFRESLRRKREGAGEIAELPG